MDISIHDNKITSYSVNSQKREIQIHTVYNDKEPFEYTDLTFIGVVIYHFECDNFKTILFDIDEVNLEEIYSEYEALFSRLKNYSWINIDYKNKEELIEKMKVQSI